MTQPNQDLLSPHELELLRSAFHQGSRDASVALGKWIGKESMVEVDSLEQRPFEDATELIAANAEICFCVAPMHGLLQGQLVLAFDDDSGLLLADYLLDRPSGTSSEWDEISVSAATETANIVCCAYLNSLATVLVTDNDPATALLPSPPEFRRDFAESLLQSALMGQAIESDQVIVAHTRFEFDNTPVNWTLLFIPDAESMRRLPSLLTSSQSSEEASDR